MIRHANRRVTLPVRTLPVALIEPALQTPLMTAVSVAALLTSAFPCGKPDCNSAVRDRSANKSRTSLRIPGRDKLVAREFSMNRHPPTPAAFDNGDGS